ncbi:MAG: lactonase family protein [Chloroflexi bacterium]|nr:lactonase family protein [Chloroflexota bacterium]
MTFVYIGTYTDPQQPAESQGIRSYAMDAASGTLSEVAIEPSCNNPSFVAVCRETGCLYAGAEEGDSAAVYAYRIDPASGRLILLNSQPSIGSALCHVCVDRSGKLLFAAHYLSGNIAVFPLNPDGSLGSLRYNYQHEGHSIDAQRQEGPHAHSVTLSPDERFAYAADLGTDELVVYRVDTANASVTLNADLSSVAVDAGEGPRHMAFHPNGSYVYLATEMGCSVIAYRYKAATGALTPIQKLGTLPDDFTGRSYVADIHVSPDGRHVYVSNRGHDSLAVYAVDAQTGMLSHADWFPSGGKWPRGFNITPNGRYLISANQQSHNMVVYERSPETGALGRAVQELAISQPVCVAFYE